MRAVFGLFAAALLGLSLAAPAARAAEVIDPASVAGLSKADVSGFQEAYVKPGVDWTRFAQVVIAPVTFGPDGDKRREDDVARITPRNRDYLARYFADSLTSHLGDHRQVVVAPAPATPALRIEAKIVRAKPNRTPYDMREPALINAYIYGVGSAAARIDVRDAATGDLLMSVAFRREGENLRDNFRSAFFWGDAEAFINAAADRLDEALPARPGAAKTG